MNTPCYKILHMNIEKYNPPNKSLVEDVVLNFWLIILVVRYFIEFISY